jgi:hypothetical protein
MDPNPSQFVQELAVSSSIRKGMFFREEAITTLGIKPFKESVGFHELRSSVKLEERLQSFSDSVINER